MMVMQGQTSPKNDGDANASPNDDVQSHSPPPGVEVSTSHVRHPIALREVKELVILQYMMI
jgi:hypothetical protein